MGFLAQYGLSYILFFRFLCTDGLCIYFMPVTLGLFTYVPASGFTPSFGILAASSNQRQFSGTRSLSSFVHSSTGLKTSKQRTSSPALPVTLSSLEL